MSETVKIELYADNLSVTQAIATQLAELVTADTIILLDGNLGSGKTTFMQAFGRALGIRTTITSPTFTLIDEYTEGRLPLYHIDLYRLESSQVPSLHLEEYWRGEDFPLGIVAIEWASKLLSLPPCHLKINLSAPNFPAQNFPLPDLSMPRRSLSSEGSQHLKNFDIYSEEDFLENPPQERTIQLIAQGSPYIELLRQFQTKKVAQNSMTFSD